MEAILRATELGKKLDPFKSAPKIPRDVDALTQEQQEARNLQEERRYHKNSKQDAAKLAEKMSPDQLREFKRGLGLELNLKYQEPLLVLHSLSALESEKRGDKL